MLVQWRGFVSCFVVSQHIEAAAQMGRGDGIGRGRSGVGSSFRGIVILASAAAWQIQFG